MASNSGRRKRANPSDGLNDNHNSKTSKKPKDLNVLIVGQSGVGKSTWINSIVNYHRYRTLEEAEKNGVICYIPTNFTVTDQSYEEQIVQIGESDRNEVICTGQSATQDPNTYRINLGDKCIRLIDTPGLGDTRGIEKDKENMKKILDHISHLKEIHGICILMKSNESKIDVIFEFCIRELLNSLHKDAAKNILFCFTNSRSSFYKAGDTVVILDQFLKESRFDEHIKLSHNNLFCLDNEAFRYLCTLKYPNLKFLRSHREAFEESWEKSVAETKRLFHVVEKLPPNPITNIRNMCSARRRILILAKPMAEMILTININLSLIDQEVKSLKSTKPDSGLQIPLIELKPVKLDKPRAVCTNCVSYYHDYQNTGITMIKYKTVCHSECLLNVIVSDTHPNPSLKKCPVMSDDGTCENCACEWNKHMHITYEHDPTTQNRHSSMDFHEMVQYLRKQYEKEEEMIMETSLKFGMFLKQNVIAGYNDAFKDYLEFLISQQERIVSQKGSPIDHYILEKLKNSFNSYKTKANALKKSMKNHETISIDDVCQLESRLYRLEFTGDSFKENAEEAVKSNDLAQTLSEKSLDGYDTNYAPIIMDSNQHTSKENILELMEFDTSDKRTVRKPSPVERKHKINDQEIKSEDPDRTNKSAKARAPKPKSPQRPGRLKSSDAYDSSFVSIRVDGNSEENIGGTMEIVTSHRPPAHHSSLVEHKTKRNGSSTKSEHQDQTLIENSSTKARVQVESNQQKSRKKTSFPSLSKKKGIPREDLNSLKSTDNENHNVPEDDRRMKKSKGKSSWSACTIL